MTEACKQITSYLNCEFEVFEGHNNEEALLERFYKLQAQGKKEGFSPLFIIPDDTLAEVFEFFLEDAGLEETPSNISKAIEDTLEQAKNINVQEFMRGYREEYTELHKNDDVVGEFISMEPTFDLSLRDIDDKVFSEIILAKIPAPAPELAAWVPMGGFNDCPLPAEQVAVFRYWQEKYGAAPAVVSYDVWQLTVENPPLSNVAAEDLAWEHFAFCYDIVMQAPEEFASVRALASNLKGSTVWGFWWD